MGSLRFKKISDEHAGTLEQEINKFLETAVEVKGVPVVFFNQFKRKWYCLIFYEELK